MPRTYAPQPQLDTDPLTRRVEDGCANNAALECIRLDAQEFALAASQLAMVGGNTFSVEVTQQVDPIRAQLLLSRPESFVIRDGATIWRGLRPSEDVTATVRGPLTLGTWSYVYCSVASGLPTLVVSAIAPDTTRIGAVIGDSRVRYVGCFPVATNSLYGLATPVPPTRIGSRVLYDLCGWTGAAVQTPLYCVDTPAGDGQWHEVPIMVPPHAKRVILKVEINGVGISLRSSGADLGSLSLPLISRGVSDAGYYNDVVELRIGGPSIQYMASGTAKVMTLGWEE